MVEINAMLAMEENPIAGKYNIPNMEGEIVQVQFTPAATQTIYIVQFSPVGGVVSVGPEM
ncbi:hypothetical protein ES705_28078 [subsurface metagenome]